MQRTDWHYNCSVTYVTALRNNLRVLIRTSISLLRNYRHIGKLVLPRINANGNFNDASFERLHYVSGLGINGVLSPSDAFDR